MRIIKIIIVSSLISFFYGCQKQSFEIIEDNNNQNLSTASPLGNLIARVAQNPTEMDNVLDKTSNCSVKLPVNLLVNSIPVNIQNRNNYQLVIDIINAYSNDDDMINFEYPITMELKNYKKLVVNSKSQLDYMMSQYPKEDLFNEIECIKFSFPLSFNIYNTNYQVANIVKLDDNAELYNFLKNLDSRTYISINYPINIANPNGQIVAINNNSQLEENIENAIDDCKTSIYGSLNSVLTSGNWFISNFLINNINNLTNNYSGYIFTFNNNGNTQATNTTSIAGTWSNYTGSNGDNKLNLSYNDAIFKNLKQDWKIIEYTNNILKLRHQNDTNSSDYLYLIKK